LRAQRSNLPACLSRHCERSEAISEIGGTGQEIASSLRGRLNAAQIAKVAVLSREATG
jgi:hypothetical protein